MNRYPKPHKYSRATIGSDTNDYTHMRRYVVSSNVESYVESDGMVSSVISCVLSCPMRYPVGSIPELDLFAYAKSRIMWADGELELEVKGILDEAKDKLGRLSLSYVA